jgi:hypothetical protein
MARHEFAHVPPTAGRAGGFLIVDDTGTVTFQPAVRSPTALRMASAWSTRAYSMSAAKSEAAARYGALDWHPVPADDPDPVAWASFRAAMAVALG